MGYKRPELTVIMTMNVLYIGKFVQTAKSDHLLDAGQVVVRTATLPNGQVLREAMVVGIGGFNKGPIKRYEVLGYTNSYKVTQENVGEGAYTLIHEEYAEFCQHRAVDDKKKKLRNEALNAFDALQAESDFWKDEVEVCERKFRDLIDTIAKATESDRHSLSDISVGETIASSIRAMKAENKEVIGLRSAMIDIAIGLGNPRTRYDQYAPLKADTIRKDIQEKIQALRSQADKVRGMERKIRTTEQKLNKSDEENRELRLQIEAERKEPRLKDKEQWEAKEARLREYETLELPVAMGMTKKGMSPEEIVDGYTLSLTRPVAIAAGSELERYLELRVKLCDILGLDDGVFDGRSGDQDLLDRVALYVKAHNRKDSHYEHWAGLIDKLRTATGQDENIQHADVLLNACKMADSYRNYQGNYQMLVNNLTDILGLKSSPDSGEHPVRNIKNAIIKLQNQVTVEQAGDGTDWKALFDNLTAKAEEKNAQIEALQRKVDELDIDDVIDMPRARYKLTNLIEWMSNKTKRHTTLNIDDTREILIRLHDLNKIVGK